MATLVYADDTCLYYFEKTADDVIFLAQKNNIIFSAKNKKVQHHTKLNISGVTLRLSDQETYLGLSLDKN